MQDLKLRELIDEVNRCNTNFNQTDKSTVDIAIYELLVAEERLNLYLKERKEEKWKEQRHNVEIATGGI